MISPCRKCGVLIEGMSYEEYCIPLWACRPADRVCADCFKKGIKSKEFKNDNG